MNMKAWNALGPPDQKILMDTWNDASKVCAENGLADTDEAQKKIISIGKKITYPTPEEAAAWKIGSEPCLRRYRDDCLALGINSQAIEKVYAGWVEIRQKYQNMMSK